MLRYGYIVPILISINKGMGIAFRYPLDMEMKMKKNFKTGMGMDNNKPALSLYLDIPTPIISLLRLNAEVSQKKKSLMLKSLKTANGRWRYL